MKINPKQAKQPFLNIAYTHKFRIALIQINYSYAFIRIWRNEGKYLLSEKQNKSVGEITHYTLVFLGICNYLRHVSSLATNICPPINMDK